MYNNIGSPTLGAARIGLLAKRSFISSNLAVAASVHLKGSVHRRRMIKRLKAATHPDNFWTYLRSVGVANCDKARILAGFASIPLLETMKTRSFQAGTLKTPLSW